MKRERILVLAIFFFLGFWVGTAKAANNSPAPKTHIMGLAPPVTCTMANRMDIFVDEDNIMWACECEALSSGFICRWQVIGGVDAVRIRRKIELHLLPKHFWYHAKYRYYTRYR